MFEAVIILSVTVLSQLMKKYVYPKYGKTGVHVVTFVLALVFSGMYYATQSNPEFLEIMLSAGKVLVYAVGVYEVILKRIGFQSGKELLVSPN